MRDDFSTDPDVPIGELADEPPPRAPRRARVRAGRGVAVVAAVALVSGGVALAVHATNDTGDDSRRIVTPTSQPGAGDDARVAVGAALDRTIGTRSFDMRFHMSATAGSLPAAPSCRDTGYCMPAPAQQPFTITGSGTINVNPTAMVSHAEVPGLGLITTRVDGTTVWEDGGGNYGMTPGTGGGPGQPLSGFAGLVQGTLGPREGAVAMNSLASPTGYLDLAQSSITGATSLGRGEVDGVAVKRYRVTIDTMRELDRPGLTREEQKTMQAALALLQQQGYRSTIVVLSVDALDLIRRAQTTVTFDDGGTVDADTSFSNFGCSTVEVHANGPWIVPDPSGCVAAGPAASTTTIAVDGPSSSAPATTAATPPAATSTTFDAAGATSTVAPAVSTPTAVGTVVTQPATDPALPPDTTSATTSP